LRVPGILLPLKSRIKRYGPIIKESFELRGLPYLWGYAIAMHESEFKPWALNPDGADGRRGGAWGLFQVTVLTACGHGFTGDAKALLDPEICSDYAARIVEEARKKYGDSFKDIASYYNSGKPYALAPERTKTKYIPSVMAHYKKFVDQLSV